jgi:hypothetical protein
MSPQLHASLQNLALVALLFATNSHASEEDATPPLMPLKMRFSANGKDSTRETYVKVRMLDAGSEAPTQPAERSSLTLDAEIFPAVSFGAPGGPPVMPPAAAKRTAPSNKNKETPLALGDFALRQSGPDFLSQARDRLSGDRGWLENDIRNNRLAQELKRTSVDDQPSWNMMNDVQQGLDRFNAGDPGQRMRDPYQDNRYQRNDVDKPVYRSRRSWPSPDDRTRGR